MFQYLYLSRLASGHDFSIFKPIVTASRLHNPPQGIGGALLFDGERFCQLLEGPETAVQALAARIEIDPRHCQLTVLHVGASSIVPVRYAWTCGYCGTDDLDVFGAPNGPRGLASVTAFATILADADLAD